MSFIQNLFTSRDNNSDSATNVGQEGRLWWDPITNRFYYSDGVTPGGFPVGGGGSSNSNVISSGTTSVAIPVLNGNVAVTINGIANTVVFDSANTTFAGNLLPTANTYTLGTADQPWKSLYVSGNTIYIDNNALASDGPNLFWNNQQVIAANNTGVINTDAVSASGNITADYFVGNGSQLSDIVVNKLVNNAYEFALDSSGNITAPGAISAVGNITASNFITTGSNVEAGNVISSGIVSAAGNVTGNYILGNGSQLTGISVSSNKIFNGNSYANIPVADGNVEISANGQAWTFSTDGALNLPNPGTVRRQDSVNIVSNGFAQLQWVDTGNLNIADPNYSNGPTNWAYIDQSGFHVESNINYQAGNTSYSWSFDTAGNLTASGNLKLVTNENLWNFDTNGTLTLPGNTLQLGLIAGNTGLKNLNSADISIIADDHVWIFDAAGNLTLPGNLSTTANIAGDYFIGNGSQLTGLPATYGNADVAAYLPTYTGNLIALTGNITTTANIQGAYLIGNGSQLTGVTASAANIFNTVLANGTPLVADSPNDTVTLASGNNLVITGDAATDTATFAVSDNPVFSGNVTANYFLGDFGTNVMADRGADSNNWDTMTEMGVYTVNRASWSGTVGTPLDSQVFVGLLEIKNSTDTALAQVFYPGTVQNSDVKIQWNRTYWNGTWSSWIKIINDEQIVVGGEF